MSVMTWGWKSTSRKPQHGVPVLIWDGFRYWVGSWNSTKDAWVEQDSGEEIDRPTAWSPILPPPKPVRVRPDA